MISVYESGRFYVAEFIGFKWTDPLTGAVIALPSDLDSSGWMFFNSQEVKSVLEEIGNESKVYQTANAKAVQQSLPRSRRWSFEVSWIGAATDDKLFTLRSMQENGYQPACQLKNGYFFGDAGAKDWTANAQTMAACAIEYSAPVIKGIGRGQGVLQDQRIGFTVYESAALTIPTSSGSGNGGDPGGGGA